MCGAVSLEVTEVSLHGVGHFLTKVGLRRKRRRRRRRRRMSVTIVYCVHWFTANKMYVHVMYIVHILYVYTCTCIVLVND